MRARYTADRRRAAEPSVASREEPDRSDRQTNRHIMTHTDTNTTRYMDRHCHTDNDDDINGY